MHSDAPQTLALAVGIGALVVVVCRRLRFPALLPLLAIGLVLGRSGAEIIDGHALGDGLKGFISVAIGLLVFEGALHLNRRELGHAPRAVIGLLTVGALVTWGVTAVIARVVLGFGWPIALLLGATLIVTGPTVVQPILRNLKLTPRLSSVLSAEAILIDPVGVVLTIATLELVLLGLRVEFGMPLAGETIRLLVLPLAGGGAVGAVFGAIGYVFMSTAGNRQPVQPGTLNLVAVGVSMASVGVGELIAPEAGLAAVTVCGIIMAQARVLGATELRAFKELLATILVGTLFILLASRFDIDRLRVMTWREAAFAILVLVVARPACVLASTAVSRLNARERAFACLFAPRGIVALAVASVAAGALQADPRAQQSGAASEAARLESVVFLLIAVSVLVATVLGPLLASLLRVRAGVGGAVMIVGIHRLAIDFAKRLREHGVACRLIDLNALNVEHARRDALDALRGDATDTRWLDDMAVMPEAGWLIAWTGNSAVDQIVARWSDERFGAGRTGIWSESEAQGEWVRYELGGNEALDRFVDAIEAGEARVEAASDAVRLTKIIGWVRNGVFTLGLPGAASAAEGGSRVLIGVRMDGDASSR